MRADVGAFFRALRSGLGGDPLPYAWVPELHKDGVHFRVHFAVGRYVARSVITDAWGRGYVHIKMLRSATVGAGSLGEARAAAGYLAKYVAKSFGDDPGSRVLGRHRYDVAQGFQPVEVKFHGRTADDVIGQASEVLGSPPALRWSYADVDEWSGAPAIWAQWAG